jgi:hypothetical protein
MAKGYAFPRFDAVDDFLATLPLSEQRVVKCLRALLLAQDPRLQEKFAYGVPYYYRRRRIFFIWPSHAYLGARNGKVTLGFCYGNLLSNDQGLLLAEKRKQVYMIRFSTLQEIGAVEQPLTAIIHEALIVDEVEFGKKH